MKYMVPWLVIAFLDCGAQASDLTERILAPRSALLTGTAEAPSANGSYVVTFPPPNNCVELHVHATSRAEALYFAISRGGFSLKPARGGLTVWTADEWGEVPAKFKAEFNGCSAKKGYR